jgi:Flp pilus assembly pilin Flp
MTRKHQGEKAQDRSSRADQQSSHGLLRFLNHVVHNTRAQDQVEYAVCVGTIALVAALAIPAIADSISSVFLNTEAVLSGAPVSGSSAAPGSNNGNNNGNCGNPNPGTVSGRSPCAP